MLDEIAAESPIVKEKFVLVPEYENVVLLARDVLEKVLDIWPGRPEFRVFPNIWPIRNCLSRLIDVSRMRTKRISVSSSNWPDLWPLLESRKLSDLRWGR